VIIPGTAVVIPCYDLGRTLDEAVQSVLEQTRPASEIVIVDDGSTDTYTRQVLARLSRHLRVVSTLNRGPARARNLGVDLTRTPLVVLLDADDVLDPTYLEKAGDLLGSRPDLGFVSCALQAFGNASYTWTPPPATVVETIARGGVHISTMFRRELWNAVGGFDPSLDGYEDTDFWLSALELGFQGEILHEPLVRYRVRTGSRYHRVLAADTYGRTKRSILKNHRLTVERHGPEISSRLAGFEADILGHQAHLTQEALALEQEIQQLRHRTLATVTALREAGIEPIEWGDMRRLDPVPAGHGKTLHEHYFEQFLDRHAPDLHARTVVRLGHNGALSFVPDEPLRCVVLPDELQHEFDVRAAIGAWHDRLEPGGVLFAGLPALRALSDETEGREGDYWRFTEASARALFAEFFPLDAIEIETCGNLVTCGAALYGLSPEDLTTDELEHRDPWFPLIVCVRAVRPATPESGAELASEPQQRSRRAVVEWHPRDAGVILLYHRIASHSPDTHGLCVAADAFRYQMEHLRRYYTPIGLAELAAASRSGRIPPGAVAVTFDDGYLDNYDVASPILMDAEIPATFFLNTESAGAEREGWWDVMERLLLSDAVPDHLTLELPGGQLTHPTNTAALRAGALLALHGALLYLPAEARASAIEQLCRWAGKDPLPPRPTHRLMTVGEVQRLSGRPGHSIGAHTTHHLLLPAHSTDVQRREIVENKQVLEDMIGQPVTAFSYPYGEHDPDTVSVVRDSSFRCAVTVEPAAVRADVDPFRMPRVEVRPTDADAFEWRLRRWFA